MSDDVLNWFTLRYDSRCGSCQRAIFRGSSGAFFGDTLIGACCEDDPHQGPPPRSSTRQPEPDVMPRGRTKADRCDKCFQIPATSGACGCDA